GHAEKTPHHFPSMLFDCTFSPDGKLLATADKTGKMIVWDLASAKQSMTMEAPVMYTWDPIQRKHSIGGIRGLCFSPDGTLLACGGIGKIGNIDHLEGKARLEVFDWQKAERVVEFESDKFKGLVNRILFAPGGEWLAGIGGAGDGLLIFYDVKAEKALKQEKVPVNVHEALLSEDGETDDGAGHGKLWQ